MKYLVWKGFKGRSTLEIAIVRREEQGIRRDCKGRAVGCEAKVGAGSSFRQKAKKGWIKIQDKGVGDLA